MVTVWDAIVARYGNQRKRTWEEDFFHRFGDGSGSTDWAATGFANMHHPDDQRPRLGDQNARTGIPPARVGAPQVVPEENQQ